MEWSTGFISHVLESDWGLLFLPCRVGDEKFRKRKDRFERLMPWICVGSGIKKTPVAHLNSHKGRFFKTPVSPWE